MKTIQRFQAMWMLVALLGLGVGACSVVDNKGEDPLKHTKKLVAEGHGSLYENGAFNFPYTKVKLIPAGPSMEELLFSQSRVSARDAFLANLGEALETMEVVTDGLEYTYAVASDITKQTGEVVAAIQAHARENSRLVAYKGYLRAKGIRGATWEVSDEVGGAMANFGQRMRQGAERTGSGAAETGGEWVMASPALAAGIVAWAYQLGTEAEKAMDRQAASMRERLTAQGGSLRVEGARRVTSLPRVTMGNLQRAWERAANAGGAVKAAGESVAGGAASSGEHLAGKGRERMTGAIPGGVGVYRKSAELAEGTAASMRESTSALARKGTEKGDALMQGGTEGGSGRIAESMSESGAHLRRGWAAAGEGLGGAGDAFTVGYAALPANVAGNFSNVSAGKSLEGFSAEAAKTEAWRKEKADGAWALVTDSIEHYGENIALKWEQAGKVFDESYAQVGPGLAALKSLSLILEGVFWDGVIKPTGKITGGALGYLSVNGIIYPAMVVSDGAVATTQYAVEVVKASGATGYDVLAPTGEAALAALMGLGALAVESGIGTAKTTGGVVLGAGEMALGNLAGLTVKYGAKGLEGVTHYMAVPVTQATMQGSGAVLGVVSGAADLAAGAGMWGAGQALQGAGAATGFGMQYGLAPVTTAAVATGGAAMAGLEAAYDTASGAVLYATGGALSGAAHTLESVIKYGISPTVKVGTTATGVPAGVAGGTAAAAAGSGVYLWGQTVRGGGYVAGQLITHGAAPVTKMGIVGMGMTASGATVGAGEVSRAAILLAENAAAGGVWVFGNTLATGTAIGGTTASVAYGTGVGLYEMASAITVPVGHLGGAGIVLSYKSISQLAAHSVLAVSDAAYLVLSLEGPRWVLYAVKGNLGDGSNIQPGAMVNLKAMQEAGETFYNLPVSQEEMRGVVGATVEDLPRENVE